MTNQLTPEQVKHLSELLEKARKEQNNANATQVLPSQSSEVSTQGLLNELTGLGGIVGGVVTGVTVPLAGLLTNLTGLLPDIFGALISSALQGGQGIPGLVNIIKEEVPIQGSKK